MEIPISELGKPYRQTIESMLEDKISCIAELKEAMHEIFIDMHHNEQAHFSGEGKCLKCKIKRLLDKYADA